MAINIKSQNVMGRFFIAEKFRWSLPLGYPWAGDREEV